MESTHKNIFPIGGMIAFFSINALHASENMYVAINSQKISHIAFSNDIGYSIYGLVRLLTRSWSRIDWIYAVDPVNSEPK